MGVCISIDRIIQLTESIKYSTIKVLDGDVDITKACKYSWSGDRVNWSCWGSYNDYRKACRGLESDFYLKILFHTLDEPSLYINKVLVHCYNIIIYNGNPFLNNPCEIIENSGFDLYSGWECAMQMQQQLSDQVVCMVGIPIYYFRTNPDASTKSYTFKEYVMHNVESVKQLKMMIADGTMPSSKPMLTEWDLEFETDYETELSKTQFATAFGLEAFPKQRDFVWIPMQKRMYMVNTAYEEKNENLMWQAVTWKLSLVKWQDQANIDKGELESVIDNLIVNTHSNIFELGEIMEGEHTGTLQLDMPQRASTNLIQVENSDYIRKEISTDTMKIVDWNLSHGNIIVSKNKYIFYDDSIITYQRGYCGDNGTVSIIFDFISNNITDKKSLFSIGDWNLYIQNNKILFGDNEEEYIELESGNTYMMVLRWGRSIGETTLYLYKLVTPEVPSYKLKPNMSKFDFDNPQIIRCSLDESLISSKELSINLYGYPLQVCSFRVYNRHINNDELSELLKYTTKDKNCIINDLARPLNAEHGYSVK